jgi:HNH endonuclease
VTITERDGLPIDVGRVRRLITPRLRLALQSRDEGCRFPGCSVPAPRTDGHHLQHWIDGGRTDLANLVSLCRFHHRRHHEGQFRIRRDGPGNFTFTAADGKPLVPHVAQPALGHLEESGGRDPTVARARYGGTPFEYEYAVSAIADASAYTRATSAPVRAGPGP